MNNIETSSFRALWLLLAMLPALTVSFAQEDEIKLEAALVRDGIYVIKGRGGNIGVSTGEDGVLLIDDQFAPVTEKIRAAVAKVSGESIRFVLNTHWHGDHTGGNENLAKTGSVVVAHDNVRKRMTTEHYNEAFDRTTQPSAPGALPVLTFNDEMTFHLNGETIRAVHVKNAHTDGDSMVHFPEANVLHMGDIYFNGLYPFIDASSGGNIDGVIHAIELAQPLLNEKTRIIPGHGSLATPAELEEYLAMLRDVSASMTALISQGKSREEVVAAKPTRKYDEVWGNGFLDPDQFVGIVFDGMTR